MASKVVDPTTPGLPLVWSELFEEAAIPGEVGSVMQGVGLEEEQLIVVAVRFGDEWRWYRSERDCWVLDQTKWRRAFMDAGHAVPDTGFAERFGIAVADGTAVFMFLSHMEAFRVFRDELRTRLVEASRTASEWWDVASCFPTLLVDFDGRVLVSAYAESPRFEEYVPDGWHGQYGDFF
ncbi:group-specific protein [Corallococcus sp. AB011P]|uniref:group-specific protein n=1 Tax=Corallococcus sp. AB011P TaxID=2316735 RepID=UPI0011C35BD5|nr:group-specific protein [Corallococcus sp. AB011P]